MICRIQWRREIWMQRAHPNFGRIAEDIKPILMLRLFVVHTHLIGPQHNEHELAGRIIHRPAPLASTSERVSVADVKAELTGWAFRFFFRLDLLLLLGRRFRGHFEIGGGQQPEPVRDVRITRGLRHRQITLRALTVILR
jgi:hypothetical protein